MYALHFPVVFASLIKIHTLRPWQNGRHFPDDIFKYIFLNDNVWILIKISLKGPFNNIPVLVQLMAWRRQGDKPLSEPMMARLPTHICVTRPQWVKTQMDDSQQNSPNTGIQLYEISCYTGLRYIKYRFNRNRINRAIHNFSIKISHLAIGFHMKWLNKSTTVWRYFYRIMICWLMMKPIN